MNGDDEIIEGEYPTEEQVFLKEWGKESVKRNLPLLNEVLKTLLTLATALSGSSLLLLPKVEPAWKIGAAVAFLFALAAALVGVLPYSGEARYIVPAEIAAHKSRATAWKMACVHVAAAGIFIGLVVVMFAIAFTPL